MHSWKPIYFPSRAGPRRICDIYDFFAPHINVLTYLLTYLLTKSADLSEIRADPADFVSDPSLRQKSGRARVVEFGLYAAVSKNLTDISRRAVRLQ